jgi:pimeloyl-ACP methyl ester carboxylesterase
MLTGMPAPRVILIHGAATTAAVWNPVREALSRARPDIRVAAPQRAYSGDLDTELATLAETAAGAVVIGVSGGATLGLALMASGVPLAGAVLHEPAVGSLVPGLLAHVAAGYEVHGVPGFGAALYGPAWDVSMAPADPEAVGRDFAMFRAFEPVAPPTVPDPDHPERTSTTVGELSPPARHEAARALCAFAGLPFQVLEGCGHAVHLEQPQLFAAVIERAVGAGAD